MATTNALLIAAILLLIRVKNHVYKVYRLLALIKSIIN